MESFLFILGMFYIVSFAITLAFAVDQIRKTGLEWYYYIFAVSLAATWPLIGFGLANEIFEKKTNDIKRGRHRFHEVKKNEILKEIEKSNEERAEDSQ